MLNPWRQKLAPHVASITNWLAGQLATQPLWTTQWHEPVAESFAAKLKQPFYLGDLCFRSHPLLASHGVLALFYLHGPTTTRRQLFRSLA